MLRTDRKAKPNVLIIYPDQMRFDAMGCSGNSHIKTPNIDRLAYEGVRFPQAYTSFPLCCPFRASLMTGKYAHANGMYANHYPIPLNQRFLAQVFADHGYRTGYVGKWHLDGGVKHGFVPPGERRLGFQYFAGFNRGHAYLRSVYYRDTDQPYASKRFEPDYQTDHLLQFLDECRTEQQPFLGMIAYGPPHPPLVAPPSYLNLYSPAEVPVRDNTPDEKMQRARRFLSRYYGLVANVDHNVGRVLDWLDTWELTEDTIVVFVSDHGDMAGEHGRFGKKTYYEASMHVPFMVRYPRRFKAGTVAPAMVDPSIDIMPTLLELCDLPIPGEVQGSSLVPGLDGEAEPQRTAVYYEILKEADGPERFPVPERGVRTEDWLYVRTEQKPLALFDLKKDPLELNNLIDLPNYQEAVAQLDALLRKHMQETGDEWSKEAHFPPPDFQTHEEGEQYVQELFRRAVVES